MSTTIAKITIQINIVLEDSPVSFCSEENIFVKKFPSDSSWISICGRSSSICGTGGRDELSGCAITICRKTQATMNIAIPFFIFLFVIFDLYFYGNVTFC